MADLFGRSSQGISAEALSQGMLSNSNNVIMQVSDSQQTDAMAQIRDSVDALSDKIENMSLDSMLKSTKEWTKKVVDVKKDIEGKRKSKNQKVKGGGKSGSVEGKLLKVIADSTSTLLAEAKSKNTIWVGLSKFDNKAMHQMATMLNETIVRQCCARDTKVSAPPIAPIAGRSKLPPVGGGGGRGMRGSGGGGAPSGGNPLGAYGTAFAASALSWIGDFLGGIRSAVGINFTDIFRDAITGPDTFVRNIRATLFEVQGHGKLNKAMEKEWLDLSDVVEMTGLWATEYEKQHMKNVQRGFEAETKAQRLLHKENLKNAKTMQKRQELEDRRYKLRHKRQKAIAVTALHTAHQLSMNAEVMGDMFMDWHLELGLSAIELGKISRGMQQTARATGVTGKALEHAVKNAEKYLKLMRDSGALTAEAANNLIAISASMEKLGVGDAASPLIQAMSGRSEFFSADPKTIKLLTLLAGSSTNPDIQRKLYQGTLLDTRQDTRMFADNAANQMKKMFASMGLTDQVIESQYGIKGGFDIANIDTLIQRLRAGDAADRDKAARLDTLFGQFYGMKPGEMARVIQGFQASSRTYEENVKAIQDEIKAAGGLDAQGRGTDAAKEANKRLREYQETALMDSFSSLSQIVKDGGGMTKKSMELWDKELTAKYGEDFAKQFRGAGIEGQLDTMLQLFSQKATESGESFADMLKGKGFDSVDQFKDALSKGDEAANIALQEIQQQLATAEKKAEDPVTDAIFEIQKWNGKIHEILTQIRAWLTEKGLQILIGVELAATLLASILTAIAALRAIGAVRGMFGGGGGGFLGGAGAGAGAAGAAGRARGGWRRRAGTMGRRRWRQATGRSGPRRAPRAPRRAPRARGRFGALAAGLGLAAGAGAWLSSKFSGGGDDLPMEGDATPVFVVNWEDLCRCLGGDVAALATGGGGTAATAAGNYTDEPPAAAAPTTAENAVGAAEAGLGAALTGAVMTEAAGLGGKALGFSKLAAAGSLASKAVYPLAAALGGITRGFTQDAEQLDRMASVYGKSWNEMTEAQKGGARGANFFAGAVAGLSTDLVDAVKDLGVWGFEALTGVQVPDWLYNFSLTETIGLGPDGWITKGLSHVTGAFGWVGEKIGEGVGSMYSYARDYIFGNMGKVDEELKKVKDKHKDLGYDIGLHGLKRKIDAGTATPKDKANYERMLKEQQEEDSVAPANMEVAARMSLSNEGLFDGLQALRALDTEARAMLDARGEKKREQTAIIPNQMDYEEKESAFVSPAMYSQDDAETYMEREKYGSESGQTSVVPSMASISDYLIGTQSEKLDRIIEELVGIRSDGIGGSNNSVNPPEAGSPLRQRTMLKRIARGNLVGNWELQPGAYSQGNVTGDGRRK